nr:uncharacterized protein LOC111416030 [Onthophagus taurus]
MTLFKVWDSTRNKRFMVMVPDGEDLYEQIVLRASTKLQINGVSLVLEEDGTVIDDTNVLRELKSEQTLLLLTANEKWTEHLNLTTTESRTSGFSTPTSATSSMLLFNIESSDNIANLNVENDNTEINNIEINSIEINDIENEMNVMNTETLSNRNEELDWTRFQIPCHKFPANYLHLYEQGTKHQHIITDMVHIIVNVLRTIDTQPPMRTLKNIAREIS